MSETQNLQLPLVQPGQAQKHVTVNEALARLDGLVQLKILSVTTTVPPTQVIDGAAYAVPVGAASSWSGQDGKIAIASNGGWVFIEPKQGWRAWIADEGVFAIFAGGSWLRDAIAVASNGAHSRIIVKELEYQIVEGGAQEIPLEIPQNSMVFALSARVSELLEGTLQSWSLGFSDEPSKFGTGMGLSAGSYCTGILSTPTTFYSDRYPLITPLDGEITSGRVQLALHMYRIALPV